jgi:hypothetical protein
MALTTRLALVKPGFGENVVDGETASGQPNEAWNLDTIDAAIAALQDASAGLSATVTLTTAQILALLTTPITLVPAPGAGKAIVLRHVFLEYLPVSIIYSFNPGTGQLVIGTVAQITASQQPFAASPAGLLDQSVKSVLQKLPNTFIAQPSTNVDNGALVIQEQNSAFTAGNGQLKVTVFYSVVSV